MVLSTHNSVLSTRLKRLYRLQPSPVVLCMQNSDFRTRITSLDSSQPSSLVFACKMATYWPEEQVSMGLRYYLSFCACNTEWLGPELLVSMEPSTSLLFLHAKTAPFGAELQVSMGPRPHLSFCSCKTAWLASEILVSKGPSPHLWILDAKQRLLDQNNKSLWVTALTCHFAQ